MKKMMAMLLASVMVAGTFATTAFAYTGDDLSIPLRRKRMQQKAQMQGKRTIPTASKSTRTCRCCRMAMRSLRMRMGT